MNAKLAQAHVSFKELLHECKLITHLSFDMYQENPNYLKEIEEILKKDKRFVGELKLARMLLMVPFDVHRYLVLDHLPEERLRHIESHLHDLKKRGPPAPITSQSKRTIETHRK